MAVMTNKQLAEKCLDIAKNYKTLYVLGCFGAPLNGSNVSRYTNNYSYNKKRASTIKGVANTNTFGFDCVCLIKGVLWGWNGNTKATYGGAKYASNGVPDIGADGMIKKCSDVSTDFSKIEVGEIVWMSGHVGVYVGNGLAVECTPKWENKVQITACNCSKSGYNRRNWTKHGKLPYVQYVKDEKKPEEVKPASKDDTEKTFKVGEIVNFVGTTHYTSANAKTGKPCKAGKAEILATYNGKHPYQLKAVSGGGSNVYGWVNKSDVKKLSTDKPKTVTVGSKVKVKSGAKTYNGKAIASWVYNNVYSVDELSGDRAVLDKNGLCTAFNVKDLVVQ